MTNNEPIARRSFLRLSGALGVGGLGVASGLARGTTSAFAADGKLLPANILTSSGSTSLVLDVLMKQQGFFAQLGIEGSTLQVSDGTKVIAALVGGGGDMCGGSGFSSLFPAIEKGAKIKILSGAGLSPVTAIFTSRPDIKTVKDLVGRSVGTGAPGALLHELVVATLIKQGVDYTKVNFVNVGSGPDVFKAVIAGTVDAGPGEVDFYTQMDKYNVHALSDALMWDELPEFTNQAMFASEQAITEKRDTIVRCMAAYAKMYRFVQSPAGKDAWQKARTVAFGKDEPAEALAQWEFFQKPNRLAANLEMDQARTDYVQNLNVKLGVQKAVLPFSQVTDMSLARDALKMLG